MGIRESIIKWHTGKPTETGWYVVTVKNEYGELYTDTDFYVINVGFKNYWFAFDDSSKEEIIAWCPLSEIEPYKEEV